MIKTSRRAERDLNRSAIKADFSAASVKVCVKPHQFEYKGRVYLQEVINRGHERVCVFLVDFIIVDNGDFRSKV